MSRNARAIVRTLISVLAVVACIAPPTSARAADPAPSNLLVNGSFTSYGPKGQLTGWSLLPFSPPVTTSTEWFNTAMTIKAVDARVDSGVRQAIAIKPEWAKVLVRGYVRVMTLTAGPSGGPGVSGAVVDLSWRIGGATAPAAQPSWSQKTDGWVEVNQLLDVPSGATELVVTPEIAKATGRADFRDFRVVAWVKTFDDEFDGEALDTTRWTASDSDDLMYAPGEQYFAPDHVVVGGGIARMHAEKKSHVAIHPRPPLDGNYANTLYGDYQYQSGEVRTVGKFQQLYGFWEFRLKIPLVLGTWPAVYLLRWDDGWPPEIDVEESTGKMLETVLQTNVYADDDGKMNRSWVNFPSSEVDRSVWRTYAVAWEPGSVSWFIDGVFRGRTGEPDARVSDVPMYIRMNLAVGTFGGNPNGSPWPQDMDCDFARVYQRHDLPLPVYPGPSQEITLPANTVTLKAISCNPMSGFTAKWSLAEGPSGATIQDPSALETKATFDKAGMYRFNLRVAKGASTASRDLLVYVNPR